MKIFYNFRKFRNGKYIQYSYGNSRYMIKRWKGIDKNKNSVKVIGYFFNIIIILFI